MQHLEGKLLRRLLSGFLGYWVSLDMGAFSWLKQGQALGQLFERMPQGGWAQISVKQ